jgi:hypothetical protein
VLRWGLPPSPTPAHPYRDTLLVYGVLAVLLVLVAWATGGHVAKAAIVAGAFFVAANAYSLARWRTRLRAEARERRERGVR